MNAAFVVLSLGCPALCHANDLLRNASQPASATSEALRPELSTIRKGLERIAQTQEADFAKRDAGKSDELARRNLAAQEAMVTWAKFSFFGALASFFLSGGGLIALLLSLRLNRQATKAAESAVVVARESNAAQSRAWVSLTCNLSAPKPGRTHAGVDGIYFNVSCTAKNHGNSPATCVSFHAEIALLGPQIFSMVDRMTEYSDGIRARADHDAEAIFPGATAQVSHHVFLPNADIAASMMGKDFKMIAPIIYGCLNYKSPHIEGIRQTRFSYNVSSINENGIVVVLMPDKPDWLEKPILLVGPGTIVAD
jgi:hypothetical protein